MFPLQYGAAALSSNNTTRIINHGSWNSALDARRSPANHLVVGNVFAPLRNGNLMEQTLDRQVLEPRAEHLRLGAAASWPAIFAGAFVAAATSLVLLTLGSGLGFAAISPWPGHGVTPTTFVVTTAIWLIVMQWISASLGGYITGRLRTRWIGTHTHEVFFRDTAHGLVMWAVATVLTAAAAAASLTAALEGGAHAAGAAASGAASMLQDAASAQGGPAGHGRPPGNESGLYGTDKLFRSTSATAGGGQGSAEARGEAAHIVANSWSSGSISDADRTYLVELVAARTGSSQADAQKRVDEFVATTQDAMMKAKADADAARKAAAEGAIYLALSMLVGAFIASVSAALGGRLRDEHYL
jgi:hypothetical protein